MPPLESLIAVALGAIPGALLRYYVGLWSDRRFGLLIFGTLLLRNEHT